MANPYMVNIRTAASELDMIARKLEEIKDSGGLCRQALGDLIYWAETVCEDLVVVNELLAQEVPREEIDTIQEVPREEIDTEVDE